MSKQGLQINYFKIRIHIRIQLVASKAEMVGTGAKSEAAVELKDEVKSVTKVILDLGEASTSDKPDGRYYLDAVGNGLEQVCKQSR